MSEKDRPLGENEFFVEGDLIITDPDHIRGGLTAILMRGPLNDCFMGKDAQDTARDLRDRSVTVNQLEFAIDQLNQTPIEAAQFLKDPENRDSLNDQMAADKKVKSRELSLKKESKKKPSIRIKREDAKDIELPKRFDN